MLACKSLLLNSTQPHQPLHLFGWRQIFSYLADPNSKGEITGFDTNAYWSEKVKIGIHLGNLINWNNEQHVQNK